MLIVIDHKSLDDVLLVLRAKIDEVIEALLLDGLRECPMHGTAGG